MHYITEPDAAYNFTNSGPLLNRSTRQNGLLLSFRVLVRYVCYRTDEGFLNV